MSEVLLLSGGIDSISLAYMRRPSLAVTVDYGQLSAEKEIEVASYVASELQLSHLVVRADIGKLGVGLLSGEAPRSDAPTPEWWPFRNQFLITVAAMAAIKKSLDSIVIGTVATDLAHSDGTAEFLVRCQRLLDCQEGGIKLLAPALDLHSAELVRQAGVPVSLLACTHSCHRGTFACGQCRGCSKHENVFRSLGILG